MKSLIWGCCLTIELVEPHLTYHWPTGPLVLSTAISRQPCPFLKVLHAPLRLGARQFIYSVFISLACSILQFGAIKSQTLVTNEV